MIREESIGDEAHPAPAETKSNRPPIQANGWENHPENKRGSTENMKNPTPKRMTGPVTELMELCVTPLDALRFGIRTFLEDLGVAEGDELGAPEFGLLVVAFDELIDEARGHVDPERPPSPAVVEALFTPDFDLFWNAYPRRIGKPAARKAFVKAAKEGVDLELMIYGATRWAFFWKESDTEEQFIPHPSTFLNQHRFDDDTPRLATKSDAMSVLDRMVERNQ